MSVQRIALLGQPGTGKTTIADAWAELTGGALLGFAHALKDEVAYAIVAVETHLTEEERERLYSRIRAEMDDPTTKDQYRGILQWWGTDYRRAQDDRYWLDKLHARVCSLSPDVPIAIDDCRFPNEYDLLRELGFRFVRLEVGDHVREMGAHADHESERHWPSFETDITLPYLQGPRTQARILDGLLRGAL